VESATDELAVRLGAAEERLMRLEALSEARNGRGKASPQENVRAQGPEHQKPQKKEDFEPPTGHLTVPKRGSNKDATSGDRPPRPGETDE
jgi:hypothetical protein